MLSLPLSKNTSKCTSVFRIVPLERQQWTNWTASTQAREMDHIEKIGVPWQLSGSWGNNTGLEEQVSAIVYVSPKPGQWAGAPPRFPGWPAGPSRKRKAPWYAYKVGSSTRRWVQWVQQGAAFYTHWAAYTRASPCPQRPSKTLPCPYPELPQAEWVGSCGMLFLQVGQPLMQSH